MDVGLLHAEWISKFTTITKEIVQIAMDLKYIAWLQMTPSK